MTSPLVTAQMIPTGDVRSFDVYSRLMKERIVFLGTQVDDNVADRDREARER